MQRDEPVPCLEGIFGVSVFRLLPNYIEVSIADGRQDATECGLEIGTGAQGAREGFRSALGISFDGKTHFRECLLKLSLPQQEISVAPRDLGGKRINLLGVQ